MKISRVLTVLKKDLKRAPRTGVVILALVYPLMITILVQLIFGSIFDPVPRVGVVDHDSSQLVADFEEGPVELRKFTDEAAMWREVEAGDLDLGLVIPAGFTDSLRRGTPMKTDERLSTRANMQALVKLEGIALASLSKLLPASPMEIEQVKLSDKIAKSWTERLLPLIVLLAFFMAGTFVTGFAIVDEKMRGTLRAMLTTPATVSEIIVAKGIFSFGIASVASLLTLWINGALSTLSPSLVAALMVAAFMTIELGVLVGFVSRDVNSLYGIVKGMGPLVIVTVMPFLWDGWPAWISKISPLWYVIHPIVEIVNEGKSLVDVGMEFGIGVGLCFVLVFVAKFVAERRVASLDAV